MALLNSIAPMMCRPFIVPATIRQSKVTIIAPDTRDRARGLPHVPVVAGDDGPDRAARGQGPQDHRVEPRARERDPDLRRRRQPADAGSVRDAPVAPRARQPRRRQGGARSPEEQATATSPSTRRPTRSSSPTSASNIRRMEEVVKSARRADGRREDLGHQAAHRVGDRDGDDAVEHLQRRQGRRGARRPAARRRRTSRGDAGAGAPARAGGGPPAIGSVGLADHPRRSQNMLDRRRRRRRPISASWRWSSGSIRCRCAPATRRPICVHVVPLATPTPTTSPARSAASAPAVSRGSALGRRRAGRAAVGAAAVGAAAQPGQQDGPVRRRRAHLRRTSRPTRSSSSPSGRDYITVRDLIQQARHAAQAGVRRGDDPRGLDRQDAQARRRLARRHDAVGPGSDQSLLFGGSEPSSDVNSILFSPAALVGPGGRPARPGHSRRRQDPRPAAGHVGAELRRVRAGAAEQRRRQRRVDAAHAHHRQREGEIQVGQNLPFPGSLGGFPAAACPARPARPARPAPAFGFGTSVQRQDVALKLEITPHVNEPDFVRLEIDNEISDVANPNFNGLGPATSKRTVKTRRHHARSAVDRDRRPHQGSVSSRRSTRCRCSATSRSSAISSSTRRRRS